MVWATRILVRKMTEEGMDYPIHLGVTEAGDGMDGRIKSAVGTGTLLADGIGDTIRVSLTEDPVNEIPVAKQIIQYFEGSPVKHGSKISGNSFYNPIEFKPRTSDKTIFPDIRQFPVVIGHQGKTEPCADFSEKHFDNINQDWAHLSGVKDVRINLAAKAYQKGLLFISKGEKSVFQFRELFGLLARTMADNPVILMKGYTETDEADLAIQSAIDFGPLFVDGLGDGIWIKHNKIPIKETTAISFQILQASGARISKTEFIACPSCGRTLYNIQKSLQEIKAKTSHLKGLKIAVMGCIVNGPGEMADADYGYVGMGRGKVALFKGKKMVKKGVDEKYAVDQLVDLIMEYGDWK
jgi:(E)-4-hydroxy-3-methylbut-2-enyl-diphosphate synthase